MKDQVPTGWWMTLNCTLKALFIKPSRVMIPLNSQKLREMHDIWWRECTDFLFNLIWDTGLDQLFCHHTETWPVKRSFDCASEVLESCLKFPTVILNRMLVTLSKLMSSFIFSPVNNTRWITFLLTYLRRWWYFAFHMRTWPWKSIPRSINKFIKSLSTTIFNVLNMYCDNVGDQHFT